MHLNFALSKIYLIKQNYIILYVGTGFKRLIIFNINNNLVQYWLDKSQTTKK